MQTQVLVGAYTLEIWQEYRYAQQLAYPDEYYLLQPNVQAYDMQADSLWQPICSNGVSGSNESDICRYACGKWPLFSLPFYVFSS